MSTAFTITDAGQTASTSVSDVFINEYMPQANGEFVKVYLYLLHITQSRQTTVSLSSIADTFVCTEKDVLRALKYWEKQKLLALSFNAQKELTGLVFLPYVVSTDASMQKMSDSSQPNTSSHTQPMNPTAGSTDSPGVSVPGASKDTLVSALNTAEEKPKYLSPSAIRKLKDENADIGQLLFLAEQYLKKTLSATDMQRILYFYDELHFPAELIEFLIEYCVSQNHRSLSYIEKVGLSWHEEGIRTVDMAKNRTSTWNKNYFLILKAFGIRGRDPIPSEVVFMNRWLKEYGFSMELIREACARTIAQTSQPSFKYAEGILSKWHKENVRRPEDLKALDEQHLQRSKTSAKKTADNKQGTNKFNNFHQRDYDFNDLEKQLLKQ